ncbi:MAG: VOC family protein [Dermatophilaceae bacterium]
MMDSAELMAFAPTLDLDRARSFYVDVLGLTLEEHSPFALGLRSGGVRLRVTRVQELTPHPFTVLGWVVDDIAAAVTTLGSAGVEFARYDGMEQDDLGVWTAPGGALVAWFHDPDGNTLSLTQL